MFGKPEVRVTHDEIIQSLYDAAFDALTEQGHESNPENLYWFFQGLQEAWDEEETTLQSLRWKIALKMEILKIGLTLTPEQKTF